MKKNELEVNKEEATMNSFLRGIQEREDVFLDVSRWIE